MNKFLALKKRDSKFSLQDLASALQKHGAARLSFPAMDHMQEKNISLIDEIRKAFFFVLFF